MRNMRKRSCGQTSKMTVSEHDGDESEGHPVGVTGRKRKKRRDKVTLAEQSPGERQYNLRRPRIIRSAARGSPEHGIAAAPATSTGVASEKIGSMHSVQHASDVDYDMDTMKNMVVDKALSEDVNGILDRNEYIYRYYRSESHSEDEDEDDDEFRTSWRSLCRKEVVDLSDNIIAKFGARSEVTQSLDRSDRL